MMKQLLCKFLMLSIPLSVFAQTAEEATALPLPQPAVSLEPAEVAFNDSIQAAPISLTPPAPTEFAPPVVKTTKSPTAAVLLSALAPGLGHYYLGETRTGNQLLGGALLGGAAAYAARKDESLLVTSIYTVQAVSSYGIYAAYRDAKLYNGDALPLMPRDNFKDLSAAPFRWSVIKKPEVWGGFLGALAAGVTLVYFTHPEDDADATARVKTTYIEPLSALPIAISEESLFRGFLQSSLYEALPAWGAITVSSLAFGAAHMANVWDKEPDEQRRYYTFSIPFITAMGAYMGWLSYKNHSLQESTALHMWYDFTLMAAGVLAGKAAIGGRAQFAHSWEF